MRIITLLALMNGWLWAQFGPRHIIDNSITGITDITLADINDDGYPDIITAQKYHLDCICYYLNLGNGTFDSPQILIPIQNPSTLIAADFNNDGKIDIATASNNLQTSDSIYLLIHQNSTHFTTHIIDTQIWNVQKIITADINNDNYPDLITIADTALYIYHNNGNTTFSKMRVPPPIPTEYYDLTTSDIDNDGWIDIIVGSVQTQIYKNTNGIFYYDSARSQSIANVGLVLLVELADYDNDGDPDLLINGNHQSDMRWYPNNGNGIFAPPQIIQTNTAQCAASSSKDIDQDGDIDILAIFPQTGKVVWYENIENASFSNEKIIHIGNPPFPTTVQTADLTGNGKHDLIWAEELSVHFNTTTSSIPTSNPSQTFTVQPHPASPHGFTIKSNINGTLSIYNVMGQPMVTHVPIQKGHNLIPLSLPPQTYVLVVNTTSLTIRKKLLIR